MHSKFSTAAFAATIAITSAPAIPTHAQSDGATGDAAYSNPCEAAPFTDFDFWVGDWVAFDYDTDVVQGIDRIQKLNDGCTVWQDWTQMTDRFRAPGAPERYAGVSMSSVLPDGKWQQVWVGRGGGTITLQGGLNDEMGGMVIETNGASQGTQFELKWHWIPEENGEIHSWGEARTKAEDGEWSDFQIQWNLRYVPRANVGPLKVSVE